MKKRILRGLSILFILSQSSCNFFPSGFFDPIQGTDYNSKVEESSDYSYVELPVNENVDLYLSEYVFNSTNGAYFENGQLKPMSLYVAEQISKDDYSKKQTINVNVEMYNLTCTEENKSCLRDFRDVYPEYAYYLDGSISYALTLNKKKETIISQVSYNYLTDVSRDDTLFNQESQKVMSLIKPEMSILEKIVAVHEYMATDIVYDLNAGPSAHTIYGALVNKRAVCQGITYLFNYYMRQLHVPVTYVTGTGNGGPHAWSQVYLDGQWYNLDSTFNFTGATRDYFLTSDNDKEFSEIHSVEPSSDHKDANSTKYDNAFWTNNVNSMAVNDGYIYYSELKDRAIYKKSLTDENVNSKGSKIENTYFSSSYGYPEYRTINVATYDGTLYFTDDKGVYKYDFDNSKKVSVYPCAKPYGLKILAGVGYVDLHPYGASSDEPIWKEFEI